MFMVWGLRWRRAQSVPPADDMRRVERLVATIAQEAATLCPLSDPVIKRPWTGVAVLFKDRTSSAASPGSCCGPAEPGAGCATEGHDAHPVQRRVLSGLYLPMFMFNGRYQVAYD
jgi:hypothetical protein